MISLTEILTFFHGSIKLGEPAAEYSALEVGGPVDYLFEPESAEECENLLEYFRRIVFPHVVLQSNTLISDRGFRGAIIVNRRFDESLVQTRSMPLFATRTDVSVPDLVRIAAINGILLGGAEIVGNSIVNARNASAAEIYALVQHVQQIIKQQSGIVLEPELQFIGFEEESLVRVA